jgi:hypothetical protein
MNIMMMIIKGNMLRVFENRVLSRTFGRKRVEVTGGWRKLIMRSIEPLLEEEKCIQKT